MRIFVAIFLLASASAELQSRVHGGTKPKRDEFASFVSLEIDFNRIKRKCGGILVSPGDRVYTAASCVYGYGLRDFNNRTECCKGFLCRYSPLEGTFAANRIRLAFNHNQIFKTSNITVKTKYMVGADFAILMLDKPVLNLQYASIGTTATLGAYVGKDVTACGFGEMDNKGNTPSTLKCTTLRVVPNSVCASVLTTLQQLVMAVYPGFICLKNADDRNVCGGDTGGALYLDGVAIGLISFFPDYRQNARCTDGHATVATQFGLFTAALVDVTKLPLLPNYI